MSMDRYCSLQVSVGGGTETSSNSSSSSSSSSVVSLMELCGRQCKLSLPSISSNTPGIFFVIAVAWPSRKLVGHGVRMSKHLGLALGSPSLGSTILLNLFHLCETKAQIEQQPPMSNQRVLSSTVEVLNCTHLTLSWCTPSQSDNTTTQLSPPRPEVIRTTSSSTKLGTRTVDSPLQDRSSEQTKEISSSKAPSHSPARSKKGRSSSPGPLIQENAKRGRTDLGSIAAVWSILEKETTKGKDLLQTFAARWLSGRFLLPGNLVTLPICGCDCVFVVTHARSSSISKGGDSNVTDSDSVKDAKPNLNINDLLPPPHLSVYKVGHMTNITLLAPSQTNKEIPENQFDSKKVEVQSLETGDIAAAKVSPVLEEQVKYSALGGLSDQIRTIKQLVDLSLLHSHLFMRYGLQAPRGLLLFGPPGTGKSTLARAAACEAGVPLFAIKGPDIVSQFYGESEQALRAVFAAAEQAAPSVVVIDEVDAIAPERKDGSEELAQRIVGTLLKLMDEGGQKRVLVIAATNRPDALDPALRRPGRFDRELEIGVPTPQGRQEILEALLCEMKHTLCVSEVQELAAGTHGFVGADLASLCHEAALSALRRSIIFSKSRRQDSMSSLCTQLEVASLDEKSGSTYPKDQHFVLEVTLEDFEVAKTRVRPSAMREVMLEVPKVRWSDIGGQEEVKQQLQEAVEWPQKHSTAFTRIGAQPPRGVLLYGPPGCSKTLLARAVASEAGLNFIAVKGPELFSKWVGESEKAVQALFARARAAAPSIVFFDEIDGLAVARDTGHGGLSVGDRVMSQLLTEMDGLKSTKGVAVIAATNRPDIIDPALLRPGRFDRLLYVGPPNETARQQIFQIQLHNTPCAPDVDCAALAARTPSYTGADITGVCHEAALAALEEDIAAQEVQLHHFDIALSKVGPSDPGPKADFFSQFQRSSMQQQR
ncbi:hypothetical protein BDL97_15G100600 [Sphagnum fallax]|nr:hypothetical protein BDL97_15G100600 [Sphagnum fallax]